MATMTRQITTTVGRRWFDPTAPLRSGFNALMRAAQIVNGTPTAEQALVDRANDDARVSEVTAVGAAERYVQYS